MSEPSEKPIIVTAQERAHPALRKLARACIALGRLRCKAPGTALATADENAEEVRHG